MIGTTSHIYLHIPLFRKLLILTRFSLINLFITLSALFSLALILIFLFSLSMLLLLLTILILLLLLLLLIFNTLLLLLESVLESVLLNICDNSVYITIWYWTIFGNYKKKNFFIKNFNIHKICHSKITEKK